MTIEELLSYTVTTKTFHSPNDKSEDLRETIMGFPLSDTDGSPARILLIADENTLNVVGNRIAALITAQGCSVETHIFPVEPALKAEYKHIEELRDWLGKRSGNVIAVGSGTVNDICKRACGELDRSYSVFATAASMDGYCSQGASILKDGFKQTLNCPAPILIATTAEVLATAPKDMTGSGFADLAAKQCSGMDWILADLLGAEKIDELTWRMVYEGLDERLRMADEVGKGSLTAVASLFEGLAATGFALQYYGGSRPASGTEHQFSHVLEMEGWEHDGTLPSHGFKVAIGSLASIKLYESLLRKIEELPASGSAGAGKWLEERIQNYPSAEADNAEARRMYAGSPALESILDILVSKRPTIEMLQQRLETLLNKRDEVINALKAQLPVFQEFKARLKASGAPSEAAALGLTPEKIQQTLLAARLIRNRYGALDLAWEMGVLGNLTMSIAGDI